MSCLREVQTISKSPNILPMPSLTRLTTGGVFNPLKNTTKIGHNELLHQEPLQPPLEPSGRASGQRGAQVANHLGDKRRQRGVVGKVVCVVDATAPDLVYRSHMNR